MQQNQWLTERLTEEHKRELMQHAEKARQAQAVNSEAPRNQASSLLAKLRSNLMNINQKSQDEANSKINR